MPADIVNANSTMCTDECAHVHTAYSSLSTQCTLVLLAFFYCVHVLFVCAVNLDKHTYPGYWVLSSAHSQAK